MRREQGANPVIGDPAARHRAWVAAPGSQAVSFGERAAALGCRVSHDPLTRSAWAPDASHMLLTPEVVVSPPDADAVASLLPSLTEMGLHVAFRLGGTSLSGQALADSVLLDVRRGFRSIEVLDGGGRVRVQGGATLRSVNARLAPYGRRLGPDPSSEVACTIGGVVANNASGMACGIEQNAYRTLESLDLVLASGTRIDTGDGDADYRLRVSEPALHDGLLRLRDRIRGNADSTRILREQFAIKNTMGYGLNSFLDHESSVQILARLMVGSEGTLGFVASATFVTVPLLPHRTTFLVLLRSLAHAAGAVPHLVAVGVTIVELMDSASLDVARLAEPGLEVLSRTSGAEGNAALLVESQTDDSAALENLAGDLNSVVRGLDGVVHVTAAPDASSRSALWNLRKGLYPAVAAARPVGTTALLEDVAVPVGSLPRASVDLSDLLVGHGYERSVIFGHAKDGNLHFMLTDRFEGSRIAAYERFNEDLVDLILGHGGSIKAEHGRTCLMQSTPVHGSMVP